jgi:hypothetical protein
MKLLETATATATRFIPNVLLCLMWLTLSVVVSACGETGKDDGTSAADDKAAKRAAEDRAAGELANRVRSLVGKSLYVQASDTCTRSPKPLAQHEKVRAVCFGIDKRMVDAEHAALAKIRDEGSKIGPQIRVRCQRLITLAGRVSDEAVTSAKVLHEEINLVPRINQALEAAAQSAALPRPKIPAHCTTVLNRLKKLNTPYAKKRAAVLKDACLVKLPRKVVGVLTKKLIQHRDRGAEPESLQLCYDLEQMSKRISKKALARANDLCAEVRISAKVKEALDGVTHHVKRNILRIPRQCGVALAALRDQSTTYCKKIRSRLLRACYIVLGEKILARKVPNMKVGCDFAVKEVVSAVRKHNLKSDALTPWLKRAEPLCDPP